MENWFRNLFLSLLILAGSFFSPVIFAAEQKNTENPVLIRPELERSLFNEAQIDGDDFEILLVAGFLSIEDFGVNPLLAVRLNYHVNETVFVQLAMAQSKAGETSYEILSGGAPLLTDAEKDLRYYSINIGYNLFPGEAFLSDQTTYNTVLYLVAGMGTTDFAGSDLFTINFGTGYRFLLNDAFAIVAEFRNNIFDMDLFGKDKISNNLEFSFGASWFF